MCALQFKLCKKEIGRETSVKPLQYRYRHRHRIAQGSIRIFFSFAKPNIFNPPGKLRKLLYTTLLNSLFCLNVMACMPHVLYAFNHIFIIFHFIFLLHHLFVRFISHPLSTANKQKKHRSIYLFSIFTDHANCKSNAIPALKTPLNCAYT